jgi:rhodanese-related sulfurtransferase
VVLFVAFKWWQRQRFLREIRMARITSDELRTALQSSPKLMLVDVRTAESRAQSGWIPGSINVRDVSEIRVEPDSAIVVYCDCPNDASAAVVARKLKALGFKQVRPLAGGIGAWRAQGFPVERAAAGS